jgi:hypothetical protein
MEDFLLRSGVNGVVTLFVVGDHHMLDLGEADRTPEDYDHNQVRVGEGGFLDMASAFFVGPKFYSVGDVNFFNPLSKDHCEDPSVESKRHCEIRAVSTGRDDEEDGRWLRCREENTLAPLCPFPEREYRGFGCSIGGERGVGKNLFPTKQLRSVHDSIRHGGYDDALKLGYHSGYVYTISEGFVCPPAIVLLDGVGKDRGKDVGFKVSDQARGTLLEIDPLLTTDL